MPEIQKQVFKHAKILLQLSKKTKEKKEYQQESPAKLLTFHKIKSLASYWLDLLNISYNRVFVSKYLSVFVILKEFSEVFVFVLNSELSLRIDAYQFAFVHFCRKIHMFLKSSIKSSCRFSCDTI